MTRRVSAFPFALLACLALAACSDSESEQGNPDLFPDPLLARALNDPLMVDPDLAWRNEANAVIAYRDGHPLPPFEAREDAANRAREAARIELIEGGQIPAIPDASQAAGLASLAALTTADAMLEAVKGPMNCVEGLEDNLIWSTRMPQTSSIMPHGMVQQAAGVDEGNCVIRVVRYLTPASREDVLEYHFTKADRARFRIERFEMPEPHLRAERRDQVLTVHMREGPGGLTAVDLIHWRK